MEPQLSSILFLSLGGIAILGIWVPFIRSGGLDTLDHLVSIRAYPNNFDGAKITVGSPAVDNTLFSMLSFNIPMVDRSYPLGRLFMAELVAHAVVPVSIMSSERLRGFKKHAITRMTLLWGVLSQFVTLAAVFPLYCFADIHTYPGHEHRSDPLVTSTGELFALIPSVALGFGIPAIMMFDPLEQGSNTQTYWILGFVLFPLLIELSRFAVLMIAPIIFGSRASQVASKQTSNRVLQCSRLLVGLIVGPIHLHFSFQIFCNFGFRQLLAREYAPTPLADQILLFLQVDYLVIFVTLWLRAYIDLTATYPKRSMTLIGVSLTAVSVLFSPGAAASFAAYTREEGPRLTDEEDKAK